MTRLVDVVASQRHFLDHMLATFYRLPVEMQGLVHPIGEMSAQADRVLMVANGRDAQLMGRTHQLIYVEHGAGQTYTGAEWIVEHPSYSGHGGSKFRNVLGFIAPSQAVADRWETAPAVAVGCPKLDVYRRLKVGEPDSICFTFHFEGTMCPENGTAWWHYASSLKAITEHLQSMGFLVYGHSHPRWNGALDAPMTEAGMELLRTDGEVFRNAHMLIADNTSLIPEMASLGRRVALLNCPNYRRDVHHGGRFWEWTQCTLEFDDPSDILQLDLGSKWDSPSFARASKTLAKQVYAFNDSRCSQRAAAFIVERLAEI